MRTCCPRTSPTVNVSSSSSAASASTSTGTTTDVWPGLITDLSRVGVKSVPFAVPDRVAMTVRIRRPLACESWRRTSTVVEVSVGSVTVVSTPRSCGDGSVSRIRTEAEPSPIRTPRGRLMVTSNRSRRSSVPSRRTGIRTRVARSPAGIVTRCVIRSTSFPTVAERERVRSRTLVARPGGLLSRIVATVGSPSRAFPTET